jgi:AcrR family transcriptional regulator
MLTMSANGKGRPSLAVRQEASANEILAAAAKAFGQRGYAATSIDDVADVLGCTKGRVYHYFRTKGDLFFGIHYKSLEWALEAIEPVVADTSLTPPERLWHMVQHHAFHMMDHSDFIGPSQHHVETNLAREGRNRDADLTALFEMRRRFERHFLDAVKAGIASGDFRSGDAELMAKAVLGTVNWMSVWYRPGSPAEKKRARDHIASELATYALNGVLAHP